MSGDLEYARKLQAQFDEEALQQESDSKLAQSLANSAHQLSESDGDDVNATAPSSSKTKRKSKANSPPKPPISANANSIEKKVKCKYGSECYRRNPSHLEKYWHPSNERKIKSDQVSESAAPKAKRQKTEESSSSSNNPKRPSSDPFNFRLCQSSPFRLFLNKIYSIPDTHKDYLSLVFPDLLNPKLGKLKESVQINFMVDLNYVMKFYKACGVHTKPLLVLYGEMDGDAKDFPNVVCNKVQIPFQFGVHHSKMMLFHYDIGVRVVIHTANLISDDWDEKTQGFWISSTFPILESGKSTLLDGDSQTNFKKDLVEYLLSYKQPDLTRWTHIIKSHDFSTCKAMFLGSIPGYHTGQNILKYGHRKVGVLLKRHTAWNGGTASPVIAQCSSIGSLGKDARSWLTGELGASLSGGNTGSNSKVCLLYPSEEDVRNSAQGYGGGSCLPYKSATHLKQSWLKEHLYLWRSNSKKRSRSMPHIKTYTRLSKDLKRAQYFILTSSNLSKAAWGQMQKQGSQFFIRSYEAGVLLLPKFLNGEDSFTLTNEHVPGSLSLPYDLPLTPYQADASPWFMDTRKSAPDVFGNKYP